MKYVIRKILSIPAIVFTLSAAEEPSPEDMNDAKDISQLKFKVAMATRTDTPPQIDGFLDDEIWNEAVLIDQFVQHEPYNMEEPSVRTELRVLYDDDYLYIAFNNFDPNPEKIMGRLSRRDDWGTGFDFNSDWVGFGIDSRNDDKTGYWFAVNAAAVQIDVAIAGEGYDSFDSTWDAVWESKINQNDKGWTAEIRVPFNIFQYSKSKVQEWGASFQRGYYNKQEEIHWPGRGLGVRGIVPHFGILKGIENIPQPKQLELMPYVLGGQTKNGETENTSNYGLDAQYTLSSNSTLNMTFNPDFGQVEADPSVLNLSAFETRLDERRPFFVEGAAFFRSRLNLFNSRRIGQRPAYFSPEQGSIINRPNATTILGATKVLGESSSGTRYGIIDAITNREYGTLEYEENEKLVRKKFMIEPYTNYFIGRLEKPVLNDVSTIGFMATDLRRQNAESATAFNADWRLKMKENKLHFNGQIAYSLGSGDPGIASRLSLSYRDPVWWEISTWGGYSDKNFDVNEMGFMRRNNNWDLGIRGGIRRDEPKGVFLRQSMNLRLGARGNNDGYITGKDIDLSHESTFKNYWSIGGDIRINPEVYEDDDLFRDSRAVIIKDEAWQSYEFGFQTDRRKRIIFRPAVDFSHGEKRGWGQSYNLRVTYRPTDFINLNINYRKGKEPGSMQWVGIIEDTIQTNIIYATTEQNVTNINYRLNWTFSPTMTLEMFYQPFQVDMDYLTYNRLVAPKTNLVEPYSYQGDKDFKIDNHVGTFVFRWEYLPGSLIYVVYNLNDNNYFSGSEGSWTRSKSNSLFIKFNYFFQT